MLDDKTVRSPSLDNDQLTLAGVTKAECYTCGLIFTDFNSFVISVMSFLTRSKCNHRSSETAPATRPGCVFNNRDACRKGAQTFLRQPQICIIAPDGHPIFRPGCEHPILGFRIEIKSSVKRVLV